MKTGTNAVVTSCVGTKKPATTAAIGTSLTLGPKNKSHPGVKLEGYFVPKKKRIQKLIRVPGPAERSVRVVLKVCHGSGLFLPGARTH